MAATCVSSPTRKGADRTALVAGREDDLFHQLRGERLRNGLRDINGGVRTEAVEGELSLPAGTAAATTNGRRGACILIPLLQAARLPVQPSRQFSAVSLFAGTPFWPLGGQIVRLRALPSELV